MKYILLTLCGLLILESSFGQREFQFKIYQNTDFFKSSYYSPQTNEKRNSSHLNFNRISFALTVRGKNDVVHEIEFFLPELSRSIYKVRFPANYEFKEGDDIKGFISSYSCRYELSKVLSNSSKSMVFSLGIGVNPYFTNTEYEPAVSTTFYSSDKVFGISLNLIPKINFRVTNRVRLDFSIPFKFYDLREQKSKLENPAIPIRQQTTANSLYSFFESSYTLRFGLAYTFKE